MTCGECDKWVRGEVDPTNIAAGPVGECRLHPVSFLVPGRHGAQMVTAYAPTGASFPACSHFKQRGDDVATGS